ncbi:hypothetical protein HK097_003870 [Rhizophlyctis rosea]|uniref:NADH dehydrogenase [ubiquinone] 1 alpha subcomplex subunit 7 n=1 Tax=Rhizophlyctis rosea TaxID=64517 RepID=A0AAD5SEH4_9FUNG|nr:hypothetical protein HK097_003870 [Rhizophlyctis rosea]
MVAAGEYRTISPGSQPTYVPAKSDKISKNYYYTRDVRRAYPATVTYTSEEVIAALPGAEIKSLPHPGFHASQHSSVDVAQVDSNFPPIINRKYTYRHSAQNTMRPDEVIPEFSITGRA